MLIHLWIKWIIIYFLFGIIFSLQFGCCLSADINTSDSCDQIIKDPGILYSKGVADKCKRGFQLFPFLLAIFPSLFSFSLILWVSLRLADWHTTIYDIFYWFYLILDTQTLTMTFSTIEVPAMQDSMFCNLADIPKGNLSIVTCILEV